MGVLDSLLHLPYASVLLPTVVFVLIAGGFCWVLRPARPPLAVKEVEATSVGLTTAKLIKEPRDQRVALRRQGNSIDVLVAVPHAKAPASGSVRDRSLGGLRLVLRQEVAVGAVLAVRALEAADLVPWVDVVVHSCKRSTEIAGHFEIGCAYVKAPPYSIQLLFG